MGKRGQSRRIRYLTIILAGLITVTFAGNGKEHRVSANNIYLSMHLASGVKNTFEAVVKSLKDRMWDVSDINEIDSKIGKTGSIQFIDETGNVIIDGADIRTAKAKTVQNDMLDIKEYIVELTLNEKGSKKFAKATKINVGKKIEIVYNGEVIQAPTVQSVIADGIVQISGLSSFKEAEYLASAICIGAETVNTEEADMESDRTEE